MTKSRLIKVFTYLGAIFLMSHIIFINNVHAIELNEEVRFLNEYVNPYWNDSHNQGYTNGSRSYSTNGNYNGTDYVQLRSQNNTNISASVGEYYSFTFTVIATGLSSGQSNKSGFFGVSTASSDCNILELHDIEVEATPLSGNNEQRTVRYTVGGFCRVTNAISQGPNINLYIKSTTSSTSLSTSVQFHNLTKWAADTSITTLNNTVNSAITSLNNIYSVLNDILNRVNNIANSQHDVNQEQTDATNNAVDSSETSGDQASTDATTATSSLLSVIGGFVNVITNAQPSNCVIDAPLNTAFSNDRFHVDLCGLDLPAGIGALTSIIAIMLIVPFCISMFNKFIGIISEFQR